MPRIATLTLNPAVDKSCVVDQVVPERKLRCSQPESDPGGGGINVARAVQELGGDATAFWMCGGLTGELLRQLLDEKNLPHTAIPVEAETRENLIVYEELSGQQFRFGMPGARLTEAEIENCLHQFRSLDPPPEYLVLSGSLPAGVDETIYARIAQSLSASTRVVLDTSGRPFQLGLETPVFLIKPNLRELSELAGRTVENDSQIHEAAESLISRGKVQVVVTSLGSGGAVLTTAEGQWQIRAPTVNILSKVGAGDSTVAGIVHALTQGWTINEAVRFGVAAGSAAVMTPGTELCRRDDAERLFREMQKS